MTTPLVENTTEIDALVQMCVEAPMPAMYRKDCVNKRPATSKPVKKKPAAAAAAAAATTTPRTQSNREKVDIDVALV